MLRLASDADVNGDLIRGLRRRQSGIDLIRVMDSLDEGVSDREVLAWASAENRVLITNDRNTMVGLAFELLMAGQPCPGLIVATNEQSVGGAIDDLLLISEQMSIDEIRDRVVVNLPLRV
jgi:hypothetical protein